MSVEEKVKFDVENDNLDLDQRKKGNFAKFLYDSILM